MNTVLPLFRVFLAVLGFVLLGWDVGAQASTASPRPSRKDSLWQVWKDPAQPDTQRLKAIQALAWPMLTVNHDSARLLVRMQLAYAQQAGSDRWTGKAFYNLATHYYYKGEPDSAVTYYLQGLPYRERTNDQKGIAATYGNLGLIYQDQGQYVRAMDYYRRSLEINERIGDISNLTSNYSNLAVLYQLMEDSAKVVEYSNKTLALYDPVKDRKSIGVTYNNLGVFYKQIGDFDKALEYQERSLLIRKEMNDRYGMAINHVNLATIYMRQGKYDVARAHTLESIDMFTALKDSASLANCYTTLGDIANYTGEHTDAVRWCKPALASFEAGKKVPEQMAACKCLYLAYKGLGDSPNALLFHERLVMLEDSLDKDDARLAIERMTFRNRLQADSLAREEEKTRLELEHVQELGRRNRLTTIILVGSMIMLLLALFFLGGMLYFQRNAERLKERTRELEKQQLISEVSLLRTQVNPHFLFNSLSILSSLVRVDAGLSEKFIDQLARSYRYILEQSEQPLVTLRTELGFIESYAFLLRIRFENKFDLDIRIPDEMLDKYKIAPLTLQLLIENAVKHNRMSVQEPLIVNVGINAAGQLEVSTNLQPRTTSSPSTGIGLKNIQNRYHLLTHQPVQAGESDGAFVVKRPLLSENGVNA